MKVMSTVTISPLSVDESAAVLGLITDLPALIRNQKDTSVLSAKDQELYAGMLEAIKKTSRVHIHSSIAE